MRRYRYTVVIIIIVVIQYIIILLLFCLGAFEMKGLRKILRVLWTAKKTNEWVLNKVSEQRQLLDGQHQDVDRTPCGRVNENDREQR